MSAEIGRAQQARAELQETEAAFEYVVAEILAEIRTTGLGEAEKREALHAEVMALDKVKARLRAVIDNGAVSAHIQQLKAQGF